MPNRGLPARPDIEQYKKQAKELVKDRATSAPEALERIGRYHPRFRGLTGLDIRQAPFKLSDAQLTIAREHDFETWSQFASHIQKLLPAQHGSPSGVTPDSSQSTEPIPAGGIELEAHISCVENAKGVVLFTQASGSNRYHPGYRHIAHELNHGSICTVLTDLLTEEEELADVETGKLALDIGLLGGRVGAITDWISRDSRLKHLPLGYFASGNGAAAAMLAAGERPDLIRAVVSSGGRPDLAGPWLWRVQAPTLFIVGSKDTVALGFTQSIMAPQPHRADREFAVIEGAHHLFGEQGALRKTANLASSWFHRYMAQSSIKRKS